jgi:hypothetical protein
MAVDGQTDHRRALRWGERPLYFLDECRKAMGSAVPPVQSLECFNGRCEVVRTCQYNPKVESLCFLTKQKQADVGICWERLIPVYIKGKAAGTETELPVGRINWLLRWFTVLADMYAITVVYAITHIGERAAAYVSWRLWCSVRWSKSVAPLAPGAYSEGAKLH